MRSSQCSGQSEDVDQGKYASREFSYQQWLREGYDMIRRLAEEAIEEIDSKKV